MQILTDGYLPCIPHNNNTTLLTTVLTKVLYPLLSNKHHIQQHQYNNKSTDKLRHSPEERSNKIQKYQ